MNTKSAATALGAIRTRSFRNAATNIQLCQIQAKPDHSNALTATKTATKLIVNINTQAFNDASMIHVGDEIGVSETTKRKSTGLCIICKRRISLTALGILYTHGYGCADVRCWCAACRWLDDH